MLFVSRRRKLRSTNSVMESFSIEVTDQENVVADTIPSTQPFNSTKMHTNKMINLFDRKVVHSTLISIIIIDITIQISVVEPFPLIGISQVSKQDMVKATITEKTTSNDEFFTNKKILSCCLM